MAAKRPASEIATTSTSTGQSERLAKQSQIDNAPDLTLDEQQWVSLDDQKSRDACENLKVIGTGVFVICKKCNPYAQMHLKSLYNNFWSYHKDIETLDWVGCTSSRAFKRQQINLDKAMYQLSWMKFHGSGVNEETPSVDDAQAQGIATRAMKGNEDCLNSSRPVKSAAETNQLVKPTSLDVSTIAAQLAIGALHLERFALALNESDERSRFAMLTSAAFLRNAIGPQHRTSPAARAETFEAQLVPIPAATARFQQLPNQMQGGSFELNSEAIPPSANSNPWQIPEEPPWLPTVCLAPWVADCNIVQRKKNTKDRMIEHAKTFELAMFKAYLCGHKVCNDETIGKHILNVNRFFGLFTFDEALSTEDHLVHVLRSVYESDIISEALLSTPFAKNHSWTWKVLKSLQFLAESFSSACARKKRFVWKGELDEFIKDCIKHANLSCRHAKKLAKRVSNDKDAEAIHDKNWVPAESIKAAVRKSMLILQRISEYISDRIKEDPTWKVTRRCRGASNRHIVGILYSNTHFGRCMELAEATRTEVKKQLRTDNQSYLSLDKHKTFVHHGSTGKAMPPGTKAACLCYLDIPVDSETAIESDVFIVPTMEDTARVSISSIIKNWGKEMLEEVRTQGRTLPTSTLWRKKYKTGRSETVTQVLLEDAEDLADCHTGHTAGQNYVANTPEGKAAVSFRRWVRLHGAPQPWPTPEQFAEFKFDVTQYLTGWRCDSEADVPGSDDNKCSEDQAEANCEYEGGEDEQECESEDLEVDEPKEDDDGFVAAVMESLANQGFAPRAVVQTKSGEQYTLAKLVIQDLKAYACVQEGTDLQFEIGELKLVHALDAATETASSKSPLERASIEHISSGLELFTSSGSTRPSQRSPASSPESARSSNLIAPEAKQF